MTLRTSTQHQIRLGTRRVSYRVVYSAASRKLRLRVGPRGVEIVRPPDRKGEDVYAFLDKNAGWILDQLRRVERLRGVRLPEERKVGEILFRGQPTRVRVEATQARTRGNAVAIIDGEIVVRRGARSPTPPVRSLENWLRKQARTEIEKHLAALTFRLRQEAGRVYIMGQRTKWANCSPRRNLSFNWRLILAPEFVLRYLVAHEVVHLAVPDHSVKFWLAVRGLCPESERAKQWLRSTGHRLLVPLPS